MTDGNILLLILPQKMTDFDHDHNHELVSFLSEGEVTANIVLFNKNLLTIKIIPDSKPNIYAKTEKPQFETEKYKLI